MHPTPPPPPPPPPPSLPNAPPPSTSTCTDQLKAVPLPNIPATGPPNTLLLSLLIYNGYPFADHWEYFVSAPPTTAATPASSHPSQQASPSSTAQPEQQQQQQQQQQQPQSQSQSPEESSHPSDVGAVLQAKGKVNEGFVLEVKRGWDISAPGQRPDQRVPLGWVDRGLLEPVGEVLLGEGLQGQGGLEGKTPDAVGVRGDGDGDGAVVEVDGEARCAFERIVFRVPAPRKTLRSVLNDGVDSRAKITQRNCQTWIVETTELLAQEGVLEPSVVEYLKAKKQY